MNRAPVIPSCLRRGLACAAVAAALIACAPATFAQELVPDPNETVEEFRHWYGDRVHIFLNDLVIPADVVLHGSVVCIGQSAVIEGEVRGDVIVILGSAEIRGAVDGQVVGVLSDLELDRARIDDQLVNVLGGLDRQDSRILGQVVNIGFGDWFPRLHSVILSLRLLHKLGVFVLLVLLIAVASDRIRRIGDEAPVSYLPAFFVGLVGYIGMWIVVLLMSFTVVGLPLAVFAFWLFKWLGIAGIFHAVGRRIGRSVGREMSVLGSTLLVFALYAVVMLAPAPLGFLGWAISAFLWTSFFLLVEAPAVGLVILTRFGAPPNRNARETGGPPEPEQVPEPREPRADAATTPLPPAEPDRTEPPVRTEPRDDA